jgi:hypothetical protein
MIINVIAAFVCVLFVMLNSEDLPNVWKYLNFISDTRMLNLIVREEFCALFERIIYFMLSSVLL